MITGKKIKLRAKLMMQTLSKGSYVHGIEILTTGKKVVQERKSSYQFLKRVSGQVMLLIIRMLHKNTKLF
jgi:hypothetical protein